MLFVFSVIQQASLQSLMQIMLGKGEGGNDRITRRGHLVNEVAKVMSKLERDELLWDITNEEDHILTQ